MTTQLQPARMVQRRWLLWLSSIGIFSVLGIMLAVQVYYMNRVEGSHPVFLQVLYKCLIAFWIYGLLTPPVLWFCWRYPVERGRVVSRLFLHAIASLIFTALNVSLVLASGPIRYEGKVVPFSYSIWRNRFLFLAFDNTVNTYAPIAVVAHLMLYYRKLREREARSMQLEGKLAKAQLSMLKMQLQPHFLFNTLNTVSALTRDNPLGAEDMLVRLSDLLRQTLDNDAEPEVPLRAELEFIGRYLEIEQVRFADRLHISIDSSPDTLDALVPNMLLQPLVENALRHGIGRKAQGGHLEVRSSKDAGNLLISVQDSGPGFPNGTGNSLAEGIGISNTRSRLEHLHPGNHRLTFTNAPDGGAIVTLRIPFRTLITREIPADEAINI